MNNQPEKKIDAFEDSGVADVRFVREKIAAQYHGDLRKHQADTEKLVAPLIDQLGLTRGTPARPDDRRSGTEG